MSVKDRKTQLLEIESDHTQLFDMLSDICNSVMTDERTADLLCAMALAREYFIAHSCREYELMLAIGYPKLQFAMDDHVRLENMFDQVLCDLTILDRRSIYNQVNILICELSGHIRKYDQDYTSFAMECRIDPNMGLFNLSR